MTTLLMPPITEPVAPRRRVGGQPDGLFVLDSGRAVVAFAGRTARFLPTVSARFREVEGSIVIDASTGVVAIDVAIALSSVTSGNRAWDEMIAVADPFDVLEHPIARYSGCAAGFGSGAGSGSIVIQGELAMRGRHRPVPLTATWQQPAIGRLAVQATGAVDRADFGLRFDIPALSKLLPQRMNLTIDINADNGPAGRG